MQKLISPIINAHELLKLHKSDPIIIVDAGSFQHYTEKHLDGALHIDLDTDLANIKPDAAQGGRHPLPTVEQFRNTLSRLGISNKNHIVVYDDKNGANAAARFWWMMRSAGHKAIQVLNGGFKEAEKVGFPINANKVNPKKSEPYEFEKWQLPTAQMDEVEHYAKTPGFAVVDVRDRERFEGTKEPIDSVAGHIPGAINIPFAENLDENGCFKTPQQLKDKYQALFEKAVPSQVAVHCGSGVTACHTLLAMAYAGFEIPKLYVGSWSEWSRNGKAVGKL